MGNQHRVAARVDWQQKAPQKFAVKWHQFDTPNSHQTQTCLSINESLIKKHDLLFLLFVFYAVLCWLLLPPFSFFFSVMFTSLFRLYSKYLTDIIFTDGLAIKYFVPIMQKKY